MDTVKGLIIKATAGFYYVKTSEYGSVECKARGVFRKKNITPYVGDRVTVETENGKGTVTDIDERKNYLIRPPVANIDKLIIISSVTEPVPSLPVIDKLTAIAVDKNIIPVVVFSKSDLGDTQKYVDIYLKAGIEAFAVSSKNGQGIDNFKNVFTDSVCALTGNSGVGKSSVLNFLCPDLQLATARISEKLGRGKHTTRTVQLYELFGGYIADTPGFSSIDFENCEIIVKENLQFCFPEFEDYIGTCKFVSCAHIGEKGCRVCEAVENGIIPKSRHESYKMMYNEVKDYKEWEHQ